MKSASSFVVFPNGPAIPVGVCDWLATAESRGIRLRVDLAGRLLLSPRHVVQPEDLAFLREHRESIIATVAYLLAVGAGPIQ